MSSRYESCVFDAKTSSLFTAETAFPPPLEGGGLHAEEIMIQEELEKLLNLINSRDVYRTGQNGTAAWTTATTLTLTNMPFQPTDVDFLAVIEYGPGVPGTDPTYVYWSPNAEPPGITPTYPMSYNPGTGVLTVQRGTFQAADSFIVIYSGLYSTTPAAVGHHLLGPEETKPIQVIQWDPAKLNATVTVINHILGMLGQGGAWISPVDFTAAWVNATQLTLAALPIAPTDVQFRGVIEWNAAGVADVYTPETHHFDWTAPLLTVTGATFTNGSQFMVVVADQTKAIAFDGTAPATLYGDTVLGQVFTTEPGAIGNLLMKRFAFTANQLLRTAEKPIPPGACGDGVITTGAVGVAVALAGAAADMRKVWFRISPHWPANDAIVVGWDNAANALVNAAGVIQKGMALYRDEGWVPFPIEYDNIGTIYVAGTAASIIVHWATALDPAGP